jgi:acyl dehydratase
MTRPPVSLRFARLPSALRYYPRAVLARRRAQPPAGRIHSAARGRGRGLPSSHVTWLATERSAASAAMQAAAGNLSPRAGHAAAHGAHDAPVIRRSAHGPGPHRQRDRMAAALTGPGALRPPCLAGGSSRHRPGPGVRPAHELADDKGVAWRERSTLLARQRGSGAQAARSARAALRQPKPLPGQPVADIPIAAGREIGRRYGRVSDDLNPIHIADWGARLFGFEHAVAHGMWSMARSLAALGPDLTPPCSVSVEFKLPLFLGSRARLHHWRGDDAWTFVLKDGEGQRPHLAGSVTRPA